MNYRALLLAGIFALGATGAYAKAGDIRIRNEGLTPERTRIHPFEHMFENRSSSAVPAPAAPAPQGKTEKAKPQKTNKH